MEIAINILILVLTFPQHCIYILFKKVRIFVCQKKYSAYRQWIKTKKVGKKYKTFFKPELVYVIFSFNKGKENFGFMHYDWVNTGYESEEYDAFMEKGLKEYTKDDLEWTYNYDKYDTYGRVAESFMKKVFAIPVSFRLFKRY